MHQGAAGVGRADQTPVASKITTGRTNATARRRRAGRLPAGDTWPGSPPGNGDHRLGQQLCRHEAGRWAQRSVDIQRPAVRHRRTDPRGRPSCPERLEGAGAGCRRAGADGRCRLAASRRDDRLYHLGADPHRCEPDRPDRLFDADLGGPFHLHNLARPPKPTLRLEHSTRLRGARSALRALVDGMVEQGGR